MGSRYRLLAIDIDGTLVNSRDELTGATREALGRARDAGIRVILATGRRYSRTLPLVEPLGLDVPLVTAGGALVKEPRCHRTLYRAQFDRAILCRVLAIVTECGHEPVVSADTFGQGFDFYHARDEVSSPWLGEYLRLNPGDGRLWPRLVVDPPEGVFAGFAIGTRVEMLALEATLHLHLPGQVATQVLRPPKYSGYMCEYAPAGVTKWSAIERLAAQWGIGHELICAVGDDVNDIPMIRSAGLGVAMGNAVPEVLAAADRIAPGHDQDGLVAVVEWLLEK